MSEQQDQATASAGRSRRRQANVAGGREHVHKVKVSAPEEARLQELAAGQKVSVARLLVESALSPAGQTPSQRQAVITELFALHRTLAGIANNINQMAKATNTTRALSPDLSETFELTRRLAERIDDTIDRL